MTPPALSIPCEKPARGRGGCGKMTVSPTPDGQAPPSKEAVCTLAVGETVSVLYTPLYTHHTNTRTHNTPTPQHTHARTKVVYTNPKDALSL